MESRHIWVLGSANVDTTLAVKRQPAKGSTVLSTNCVSSFGGKGANQAAAAAMSGGEVSFIGCVGNDAEGDRMVGALERLGVNTDYVTRTGEAPSGRAFITVDTDGANSIVVYPGANRFIPESPAPDFQKGDLLVAQFEIELSVIRRCFRLAREAGAVTILNPSPFQYDEEILGLTDILIANEHEAGELSGAAVASEKTALDAARAIVRSGVGTVVISLGKEGALAAEGGKAWRVQEFPVTVKDTQGAGDAFLGMFAASMAAGMPVPQALLKANIASSLSVGNYGSTQCSFPNLKRVEAEFAWLLPSNAVKTYNFSESEGEYK